jgi:hypothetical protein
MPQFNVSHNQIIQSCQISYNYKLFLRIYLLELASTCLMAFENVIFQAIKIILTGMLPEERSWCSLVYTAYLHFLELKSSRYFSALLTCQLQNQRLKRKKSGLLTVLTGSPRFYITDWNEYQDIYWNLNSIIRHGERLQPHTKIFYNMCNAVEHKNSGQEFRKF